MVNELKYDSMSRALLLLGFTAILYMLKHENFAYFCVLQFLFIKY